MPPFRVARPRFLAHFALEGALIFAVLYGLAGATSLITAEPAGPEMEFIVLVTGGLFSVLLLVTQSANIGDQSSLRREIVLFSVNSALVGILVCTTLFVLYRDYLRMSILLPLEGAVAVPAAVAAWRWLSIRYDLLNAIRDRVLIVGTGETARQVCRWIASNHGSEYAVVGFADEDDTRIGAILAMGVRIQTDFENLARFAPQRAERIVVALDEKRGKFPVKQLMELRLLGLEIEEATSFLERISGKISVETMLPSWLIFSEGFKSSPLRSALKRFVDVSHSLLLLIAAGPVMLLTGLLIVLDSGLPVFYRQSRLGREGREFNVYKFRSMRQDAEKTSGPTWAKKDDPRVTRIGRLIRKLRIDELPQLLNVLKGEMSFVGPRPERGHFVRQLEGKIPYYGLRMTVRPGITGWAQVEYGYGATQEDAQEKLKYDLYYIKNNNVLLDLWIILKTVKVCLLASGAR